MAQTTRQKANASKARRAAVARNQEQAFEPILVLALAPVPVPRLPARRRRASNDDDDNAAKIAALELCHL